MNVSLVSERYARALFELAVEKDLVETVYTDNKAIEKIARESRELRLLLSSPIVNSGKKLAIIREIFSGQVSELTLNYLLIMVRKKREGFIPDIAREVTELYKSYKNILTVQFRSPVEPGPEVRNKVLEIMKQYTQSGIELETGIDESLLGGFILSWDDKQYDASIRRELENLRNAIAKVNLYKKGF
jgi:F-type H+-transporting ATPase subunit delta